MTSCVYSLISVLVLLILASQRIEEVLADLLDSSWLKEHFPGDGSTTRGSMPSIIEWAILAWVAGNTIIYIYTTICQVETV